MNLEEIKDRPWTTSYRKELLNGLSDEASSPKDIPGYDKLTNVTKSTVGGITRVEFSDMNLALHSRSLLQDEKMLRLLGLINNNVEEIKYIRRSQYGEIKGKVKENYSDFAISEAPNGRILIKKRIINLISETSDFMTTRYSFVEYSESNKEAKPIRLFTSILYLPDSHINPNDTSPPEVLEDTIRDQLRKVEIDDESETDEADIILYIAHI